MHICINVGENLSLPSIQNTGISITNQNKGEFGTLEIYRFHGKMKRKQDWREQDFQIKNGFLRYFKSNTVSAHL